MTIPHIAIISSFLLAGNNPNTLEGVVGLPTIKDISPSWHIFSFAYHSRYKPAWIWNRGQSKKMVMPVSDF